LHLELPTENAAVQKSRKRTRNLLSSFFPIISLLSRLKTGLLKTLENYNLLDAQSFCGKIEK